MVESLQMRTPTMDDLARLSALGRETFVETFGSRYPLVDLQTFLQQVYSESAVATELNDSQLRFQVIDDGQELVAFTKIGPVHVPLDKPPDDGMEIWQLYVRQRLLGRGLGTQLMQWADRQFIASGASQVFVSVFSENHRALRFYQRHGFGKFGEYGFRVGTQIDREWIMCRQLPHD